MTTFKNVTLSTPSLSPSQLKFRLGLVRQRTQSYQLDSMDFIMMDLERPDGHHRHAYHCTGDLTGRLLEFLSHAEGVDGRQDGRLPELFERILRQRQPSGLFGRLINRTTPTATPWFGNEVFGACARYFPGFVYCYEQTNDIRALDAAIGVAELTIRNKDLWRKRAKETGGRFIELWITGAFGHREITATGYGLLNPTEAIWCCLHNGGLALAEYARHTVTLKDETIHINQLLPGEYRLPIIGKPDAEIRILTNYPAAADTVIEARHVPENFKIRLRVPSCVKHSEVSEQRNGDTVVVRMKGLLGHHIEQSGRGKMIYYGPLVLVPIGFNSSGGSRSTASQTERALVPKGYIPDEMPEGLPELQVGEADADGLLHLSDRPLPDWTYCDEGPGARCAVPGSAANIPVLFPDGQTRSLRFVPECYFTSCLALWETPIVFSGTESINKSTDPKKK